MARRDVGAFLAALRDFGFGRKNVNVMRFVPDIAPRTQPPPNLPDGPHAKLSGNYYYTRDARREVKPPVLIADAESPKAVTSGKDTPNVLKRVPGRIYLWDI